MAELPADPVPALQAGRDSGVDPGVRAEPGRLRDAGDPRRRQDHAAGQLHRHAVPDRPELAGGRLAVIRADGRDAHRHHHLLPSRGTEPVTAIAGRLLPNGNPVRLGDLARRFSLTRGALTANAWFVYLFFYAPIALLVVFSFSADRNVGRWGGFTLSWYDDFIGNTSIQNAIWVSVRVALLSTVISVVLGTLAAFAIERFRFRGRQAFDALLYLPIIIPDVTMAVMMLLFFSEFFDLVNLLFGTDLRKGFASITVSHIAFNISFVSVVVRARLAGMDKRLEEAAMDLYASRWKAFRHVTLPQIAPGVAGGALLALTLSLDDVVVTQFASGPGATTLPVYVFGLIRRGVTPLINSVSVVMLVASIGLVLLSLFVQRSRGGAAVGPPGAVAAGRSRRSS
ncbi:MAG: ABC transporter permease [Acidimicrobiia bacterium]|nr:ABC transporter permease [Acidimicrobiia bacterium]MYC44484.1 ABC transporter permease [Acidimicrobiia bacterium]